MTVNISTDLETDRMMSLRTSSQFPLPPEIALAHPRDSKRFFSWMLPYDLYGLSDHPLVRALMENRRNSMMASALYRAEHLDRVAHCQAWLGKEIVHGEDLTGTYTEVSSML